MAILSPNEEKKNVIAKDAAPSVNSEAAMDDFLQSLNLYRKPVAKDGSCLFRAVAEHVYNTQEKHLDVRKECINYMKKNNDLFSGFVAGSYEHHLFVLQNPKEWAGQVEIVALSLLYHHDFLIYQEINQQPNRVTENGYDHKIMLCFSNGNHYDCVYSKKFKENAALIQSVLYEFIYQTVLPECQKREDLEAERNEIGDGNKNSWIDIKSKAGKNKTEGAGVSADQSIAIWEIERSLDTTVYRNVALEVWEKSKLEQTQADRALAMKMQFKIGEYCLALVGDSSSKQYLKAQIKDMVEEQYVVYVPEQNETYYVFLQCLKPFLPDKNTDKSEQLTYDKLPGYYRKSEDAPKDFQYPKKRQKSNTNRGNRDEDGRQKRADGRNDPRSEGRFENRNEISQGGSQQRRDKRDRRGGQGGDRGRHDRGEKRDSDRKGRSNEKGGKRTGLKEESPSEDQKPAVDKKVDDDKTDLLERSEVVEALVTEEELITDESGGTDETEKEKTAKQDESPAAFWKRMRNPDPLLPGQKAGSKPNSPLETQPNVSDPFNGSKDNDKASRNTSLSSVRKPVDSDGRVKEKKFETKPRKTSEADSGKADTKPSKKPQSQTNKHPTSKHPAKSYPAKDTVAENKVNKTANNRKENSIPVAASEKMVNNAHPSKHESCNVKEYSNYEDNPGQPKQDLPGSSVNAEPIEDVSSHINTTSKHQRCQEDYSEDESLASEALNEQSNAASSIHGSDNPTSDCNQDISATDNSAEDGQEMFYNENAMHSINYEEVKTNDVSGGTVPVIAKICDNVCPYDDLQTPIQATSVDEKFSAPTHPFSAASEIFKPAEKAAAFEPVGEQKYEQQRIRILTKGNEDQFDGCNLPKSPDPESRKSLPKKVSFGKVEISEVTTAPPETHLDSHLDDQGARQNSYPDSNGMPENNEHMLYDHANYNAATAMPTSYMPMMMTQMMHGNEQIQIPQKFSMDPEGRDLPQHMPTIRYFYNLGLQFFMMQHQPPAFMQIPQIQATAAQLHPRAQSVPVQSSSHMQMPYRYGHATDVTTQIHTDQQDGFIPASTVASSQYEMTMPQKQQPQLHQRQHYHAHNHQGNTNQYEPPPRMRRVRGRGSTLGYNKTQQQQQQQQMPRVEKRNHSGVQAPQQPLPYTR